ncbi:hypothetical protein ACWCSD_31870 [Nonomuraea sp. NPDC001684]
MLNLITRNRADAPTAEPAEPAPIARRTRPTRPAPDLLTIHRKALALAVSNLVLSPRNQARGPESRLGSLHDDIEALAGWLADAPDGTDYDTRVEALEAHITIYGGKADSYWAEERGRWESRSSGQALVLHAQKTYDQIVRLTTS